jgi:uncharacterized protein (DUF1778 family)
MTITLDLTPDIEQCLLTQAQARGVSLTDFVEEIVEKQARQLPLETPTASQAKNLVELFENSPFKGLNIEFERDRKQDYGREIEL